MGHTLVAFHAHPDDEALTTGGTLAKAAAAGHRVVLVTATDGAVGLASTRYAGTLADVRRAELRESARVLGVSRVELLGYADSGLGPVRPRRPAGSGVLRPGLAVRRRPSDWPTCCARSRLTCCCPTTATAATATPTMSRSTGSGRWRRRSRGTPRLLEVAVDRRIARIMAPKGFPVEAVPAPTHVVDVRAWIEVKRAAIRAHRSQLTSTGWVPRNNDDADPTAQTSAARGRWDGNATSTRPDRPGRRCWTTCSPTCDGAPPSPPPPDPASDPRHESM